MGFSAVAATASVASAAAGAYSSIKQGEAASEQQRYQQRQQEQREQQLRTRALQDETARREALAAQMSTIDAVRAGRGLSQTSPTALVIRDDVTGDAMDAMRVSRLNILNGAEAERQAGIQSGNAASNALTTGYLGAGKSLLDFGAKAFDTYGKSITKEPLTGRVGGPV